MLLSSKITVSYQAGLFRLEYNFTELSSGTYTYKAYAVDQAGNLNETEEKILTINTPPTQPSVNLTPDNPTTLSTLYCNVTTESTDSDSDDANYTYNWYLDDVFNTTIFNSNLNYNILGSGNTSKGQDWNCTVWAWDGQDNSTPDLDVVSILNYVPTINVTAPPAGSR